MKFSEIGYLFDWDGVVVDSSRQHRESWDMLAAAEKLPLFDGHFELGFGKKNTFIIPNILKWTQEPAEIARLGDRKEEFYREIVARSGLQPLPGARAFLERLKSEGCRCCVASSTPRENIEAVLEVIGLQGFFDETVAAADVNEGKPHPEVFLKAAAKIGFPRERCVVFEDSFSGVEAGFAAGMPVVGLATTNPAPELLARGVAFAEPSFETISLERIATLFE